MSTTANNKSWIAGIVAAGAASLCCIVPVIALIGGVSGVTSSISWLDTYRPYFVGITIIVFALAWYYKLKPSKKEDCCSVPTKNSFLQSTWFLAIATIISALLITFPYYASSLFYKQKSQINTANAPDAHSQKLTVKISGMTCEACTLEVNEALRKVPGVLSYETSFEKAQSSIQYDITLTTMDSIITAINKTGYAAYKLIYK